MCKILGDLACAKNQHAKLKMKNFFEQPGNLLSVWGLNVVSFLNNSLPYLQFLSLILAISLSIMSIKKMSKSNNRGEEENDPIL